MSVQKRYNPPPIRLFATAPAPDGRLGSGQQGPSAGAPIRDADEALRAAHRLAARLCLDAEDGGSRSLFAGSGLGAMSVPDAHGGPGLSFETVAHAARIVAGADREAGEAIRQHLLLVSAIRSRGTPAQRDALFGLVVRGLRFGRPLAGPGGLPLRAIRDGGDVFLDGRVDGFAEPAGALAADLQPILVRDEQGRSAYAIVDHDVLSVWQRDPSASLRLPVNRLLLFGSAAASDDVRPDEAIRSLLRAAVEAGAAGRAIGDRIAHLRGRNADRAAAASVGDLRLRLDAAIALLEKAGRAVDRAVIRPTANSVAVAQVAAAGARILATELANLAGVVPPGAVRAGRVLRPADPIRTRYAQLGEFYLSGLSPVSHAAF